MKLIETFLQWDSCNENIFHYLHKNKIVASLTLSEYDDEFWIQAVYVDVNHRKKGLAQKLVDLAIFKYKLYKQFKDVNDPDSIMKDLYLNCNVNNHSALHIYRKFNFIETGIGRFDDKKKYYYITMKLC